MATSLINISGIGPQTAKVLQQHGLDSAEALVKQGEKKLQSVPGFGPSRAKATIIAARTLLADMTVGKADSQDKRVKNKKQSNNKKDKAKKDKSKKDKTKKSKKTDKDKKRNKPKKSDKKKDKAKKGKSKKNKK